MARKRFTPEQIITMLREAEVLSQGSGRRNSLIVFPGRPDSKKTWLTQPS